MDDYEASFKTDGEFILVNRNDSDIIMRLLNKNGYGNVKVMKKIDDKQNGQDQDSFVSKMNSNDQDLTLRDIN